MFGSKRIYLDWAAAAPTSARAKRVFDVALDAFGNPSSPHTEGRAAKAILEDARARIAKLAGTKAEAVIFTANATEANALAIRGHIKALVKAGREAKDMHVLYMPSAHSSIGGALAILGKRGVSLSPITLKDGAADLAALKSSLTPNTVLVCMDLVCGETGALYDVRDVRRVLDAYNKENGKHITLHVDASQAPLVTSYELNRLGADMLSLDAQKVGGVRGIGVLIAPRHVPLLPLIRGGGQERGMRPGTEPHALAAAFVVALEDADKGREKFVESALNSRKALLESIKKVEKVEVNEGKEQAPHILNLSFIGRDTDYLAALLDEAGFAVSTKSACESDSEEGSRAVLALTNDEARAVSTLRVSWGPETRGADLMRFSEALINAVQFLDNKSVEI
ncbi:MAG: Cysteine desulfurase [Parcubacteria group bacterium]|nr:Cysteine desulfurase [Parcubacteria group bacterium]